MKAARCQVNLSALLTIGLKHLLQVREYRSAKRCNSNFYLGFPTQKFSNSRLLNCSALKIHPSQQQKYQLPNNSVPIFDIKTAIFSEGCDRFNSPEAGWENK